MKFCIKCGAQLDDSVKFCKQCGNPVPGGAPVQAAAAAVPVQKKGSNKGVAIAVISVIAILVVALLTVGIVFAVKALKKYKYDPTENVAVKFDGFDGKGTAKLDISEKFFSEMVSLVDEDCGYEIRVADDKTKAGAVEVLKDNDKEKLVDFVDSIEFKLDKTEGLKNGDKVKVTIEYDEDAAKKAHIVLTKTEFEFEVKDLKEIVSVDPFETIKVTWSGTAPSLRVTYSSEGSNSSGLRFSYKFKDGKTTGFNVGDEVELTVTAPDEKTLLEKGYQYERTSLKVTIDKADAYVTKLSEISSDNLKKMSDEAAEYIPKKVVINSKIAPDEAGAQYVGCAYAYYTSMASSSQMYLVYSLKVKVNDEGFGEYTMYYVTRAYNLMNKADGTMTYRLANSLNYDSKNTVYFDDNLKKYSTYGFKSLDDVKNYINTTVDSTKYEIEFGDGLK